MKIAGIFLAGGMCLSFLLASHPPARADVGILAAVAEAYAQSVAGLSALPPVTGPGGAIQGAINGADLVSNSTGAHFATGNAELWRNISNFFLGISANIGSQNGSVHVGSVSLQGLIGAEKKDLYDGIKGNLELLQDKIVEEDHDASDKEDNCAGMQAGMAAISGGKEKKAWKAAVDQLAGQYGDAKAPDWAKARGLRVDEAVENSLLSSTKTMLGDWLVRQDGSLSADDVKRQGILIDVVSSPHPVPAVIGEARNSTAGKAIRMETVQKGMQSAVVREALAHVGSQSIAMANYRTGIEAMEKKAGLSGGGLAQAPSSGGMSYLQYLDANVAFLLGPNQQFRQDALDQGAQMRQIADIMRSRYELSVSGHEELQRRLALLAVLAGSATEDSNAAIAAGMKDNRR